MSEYDSNTSYDSNKTKFLISLYLLTYCKRIKPRQKFEHIYLWQGDYAATRRGAQIAHEIHVI
jgi:hypothetical protein